MQTPKANSIHSISGRRQVSSWAMTLAALLGIAAIRFCLPGAALGATIPVTTTADAQSANGQCSLREATRAANEDSTGPGGDCAQGSGADTIAVPSGHFTLSLPGSQEDASASGDLDVLSNLTIAGAGAGATTIDADQIDRVLEVMPGRIVTIGGVTIAGGHAPDGFDGGDRTGSSPGASGNGIKGGDGAPGGGIFNDAGNLTIVDSVIAHNVAGDGGKGGNGHGADGSSSGANGGDGGAGAGGIGGNGGAGGGIYTTGSLTLTRVTVSANRAGAGADGGNGIGGNGGIVLSPGKGGKGGSGNGSIGGSGGAGGGVAEASGGVLTMEESTISENAAGAGGGSGTGQGGMGGGVGTGGLGGFGGGGIGGSGGSGGGIWAENPAVITRSLISGNVAGAGGNDEGGTGGLGGTAIGAAGDGGFAGAGIGGSGGRGGGLAVPSGTVVDVTLDGNHAGAGGATGTATGGNGGPSVSGAGGNGGGAGGGIAGSGGFGGGMAAPADSAWTLRHATIVSNTAGSGGALGATTAGAGGPGSPSGVAGSVSAGLPGIAGTGGAVSNTSFSKTDTLSLANSIVAGNGAPACSGFESAVGDGGHDISLGDATCPGADVNPLLGALKDNGGPTLTRALPSGSPAIDAVPSSGAGCPAADQRGVARPSGPACDAGAYEQAPPNAVTGQATGVSAAAATLQGELNPNAEVTEYHFELGTTSSYSSATPSTTQGAGVSAVTVSAAVGGLQPGAVYHYRLVATNADGTTRGQDATFTTTSLHAGRPDTKIRKAKISQAKNAATFKFVAVGEATGFQCSLKRKGRKAARLKSCKSPKRYRSLKPGKYTFKVRAVGPGGSDPSPAIKRFEIKP